jgi:putative serine protease PepD
VVTNIAGQLVKSGKVTNSNRAYLGVKIADTGEESGVYVTQVLAGTPAAKAGLKAGDLITSVNGSKTPTSSVLGTVLAGLKPGHTVKVTVMHQNGTSDTVSLTLGEFSS